MSDDTEAVNDIVKASKITYLEDDPEWRGETADHLSRHPATTIGGLDAQLAGLQAELEQATGLLRELVNGLLGSELGRPPWEAQHPEQHAPMMPALSLRAMSALDGAQEATRLAQILRGLL